MKISVEFTFNGVNVVSDKALQIIEELCASSETMRVAFDADDCRVDLQSIVVTTEEATA